MAKKGSKKHKGGGGGLLLSVALGAALAAGAGYYATHKEEVDKEAKKKIDELAKLFAETKTQIEPKVKEVWGVVTKEAVEKYMDVRGALLHALEDERVQNAGDLFKDHYEEIVENVVKQARKSGILDAATQKKLEKLFKLDWEKISEAMMTGAEVAASVAKKSAKSAKKTVKKATQEVKTKRAASKRHKKTGTAAKKATNKSVKKAPIKKTAKKSTRKSPTKRSTAKKPTKKSTTKRTKK